MKMHHLSEETVATILEKAKSVIASGDYAPDAIEEIFKLSKVNPEGFLDCKNNDLQKDKVNFELDAEKGVRFFSGTACPAVAAVMPQPFLKVIRGSMNG